MTGADARWRIYAASETGTSHLSQGLACQDTHLVRILKNGTIIVALADGAGSARYAAEGSSLAVQAAADYLSERLVSNEPETENGCRALMEGCLACARSTLEKQVAEIGTSQGDDTSDCRPEVSLDDFATTLLSLFVSRSYVAALQVGDGAIVCRKSTNSLEVFIEPERGEYLNETYFVTSDDLAGHALYKVASHTDLDGFAVFSDGIQMLALVYPENTPHAPFFNPLFDFARRDDACNEDLRCFLVSPAVCERTDDDKTLVLAVRI